MNAIFYVAYLAFCYASAGLLTKLLTPILEKTASMLFACSGAFLPLAFCEDPRDGLIWQQEQHVILLSRYPQQPWALEPTFHFT